MNSIGAGILAITLALVLNRLLVRVWGVSSIFWGVPLVEEVCKLGSASLFHAPFGLTYLVFGIGEAFYDLKSQKAISLSAALLSMISHYLFGLGAELVWDFRRNMFLVVLVTVILHAAWNRLILALGEKRRES